MERVRGEEIGEAQNTRVQEAYGMVEEKRKEALCALEDKKFEALHNIPIDAATIDSFTATHLVTNSDYTAETFKTNDKNSDALAVQSHNQLEIKVEAISDIANNNKEKVKCGVTDLTSVVAKPKEESIEEMISIVEKSERSSVYKEPVIDELVRLGDEIRKSVDLAQEILVKLEEKIRQRELKDKELARRKDEEAAFAADKKKWLSPNEGQVSDASFSTNDMDGKKTSQTFSPFIVEKSFFKVTPDNDETKVTEPNNSETL